MESDFLIAICVISLEEQVDVFSIIVDFESRKAVLEILSVNFAQIVLIKEFESVDEIEVVLKRKLLLFLLKVVLKRDYDFDNLSKLISFLFL